jgi:DNA-binding LacI/PurR family transcriptional regulator
VVRALGAIGLALPVTRMDDRFVTALVHSLAEPIIEAGSALVTRIVSDTAAEEHLYRHWSVVGGIDGVVLLDARRDDPRVALLGSLGFPLAAVVDAALEPGFPAVVVDFDAALTVLRTFLATRPARPAVYVSGPGDSAIRSLESGTVPDGVAPIAVVHAESPAQSLDAVEAAVASGPVTLVFDSDVWAAAALGAVRAGGLRVPEDVAIVSATNSALCQSTTPSITAIDRRGDAIGAQLGRRMLEAVAGDRATWEPAPEPFIAIGETA